MAKGLNRGHRAADKQQVLLESLSRRIDLITSDISGHFNTRLKHVAANGGSHNVGVICDYMIAEQNEINIKPSTKEMEYWAKQVVKTSQGKVQFGIMGANNHYAGFGPMTANTFRKMLGLKEVVWEAKKQQSLSDF